MLKGVQSQASTTLWLGASQHYPLDVVVDGIEVLQCDTYLHIVTHVAESRITHKNVLLKDKSNVISTDYGLIGNQYLGSRTILGSKVPTDATPGLLHDVYRLSTPQRGDVYEWVCTASGSGSGAAWTPMRRLDN